MIEPGSGAVDNRGNGVATASLVAGITSIVCCGPWMGVPAIVLGLVSRNRIAQSSGELGGGGLATAGMVLGIAGSIVWTIVYVFGGMFVYGLVGHSGTTRSAIPCDLLQHTVYHYHVAVQIIDAGTVVPIPTDVGRTGLCFYWIHMHADSPGIIHIESPEQRTFTLGDFFDVWAKTSSQAIRLDSGHVGTTTLAAGQTLVVFVDGQRYEGDPRGIPLVSRGVIQFEVTPPILDPPPAYVLPPGYQA